MQNKIKTFLNFSVSINYFFLAIILFVVFPLYFLGDLSPSFKVKGPEKQYLSVYGLYVFKDFTALLITLLLFIPLNIVFFKLQGNSFIKSIIPFVFYKSIKFETFDKRKTLNWNIAFSILLIIAFGFIIAELILNGFGPGWKVALLFFIIHIPFYVYFSLYTITMYLYINNVKFTK
ncbi:hypothetical protein [Mycoplasmopsis columbina]|uniref:hypothetical protein n=1 Tax=Mycoplasmopsis columbina TaxID=114881 RepID=UPI0004A728C8|nr:hypothetical protein [Mycoplasmopsis columbina]VEU76984.1 Uncharacterised protein [Mycoplasmopsis columbina]